jgi:hypothetical protein
MISHGSLHGTGSQRFLGSVGTVCALIKPKLT